MAKSMFSADFANKLWTLNFVKNDVIHFFCSVKQRLQRLAILDVLFFYVKYHVIKNKLHLINSQLT